MPFKYNPRQEIKTLEDTIDNLRNIIHHIPGCVYWKDKEGVYLGCNQIFLEMAGLSSIDEVIGKKDKDLCWKEIVGKGSTFTLSLPASKETKT